MYISGRSVQPPSLRHLARPGSTNVVESNLQPVIAPPSAIGPWCFRVLNGMTLPFESKTFNWQIARPTSGNKDPRAPVRLDGRPATASVSIPPRLVMKIVLVIDAPTNVVMSQGGPLAGHPSVPFRIGLRVTFTVLKFGPVPRVIVVNCSANEKSKTLKLSTVEDVSAPLVPVIVAL